MGKKTGIVLCDSNILFQLLKGNKEIEKAVLKIGEANVGFSIITQAEAYAGSPKEEIKFLRTYFRKHPTYPIDREVSTIFTGLILSSHERHSKWIPDALIAATAIGNQLPLYTLNRKDFDFIPELKLYNP